MIITRSPFRITLGGGGTDLPSYYQSFGGFLIAAAIDKYVYITLHTTRMLLREFVLKYSKMERVGRIQEIEHPIIREALRLTGIDLHYLEIASMADVPAGTGLGSSGSFTVALLKALYTQTRAIVSNEQLAELACRLEIDILREPVGKQDQYIATFGGITCFEFYPDGKVKPEPLPLTNNTLHDLEENLLLFFTGYSRSASEILQEQHVKSQKMDHEMIENLHFVKQLGLESKEALLEGDVLRFANLMNIHWQHKKKRSKNMSNTNVDRWYEKGLANGAVGGKMVGAGGGGFLMFYARDKAALRKAMEEEGLQELRFKFDFLGTQVISR